MKTSFFLLLTFFTTTYTFGQSHLAFVRTGLKSINVYNSTKTKVVDKIDKEKYFYFDTLVGNWFSVSSYGGFCKKNDVQVFSALPTQEQKKQINKVLKKFQTICRSGKEPVVHTSNGFRDTVYIPKWEAYFDYTFDPILSELNYYYQKTRDTTTLLEIFKIANCHPDGGFSASFHYLIGHCYDIDKMLFVRQIRRIKNKELQYLIESNLLNTSIDVFYTLKYRNQNKSQEEVAKLVNKEKVKAEKLLK